MGELEYIGVAISIASTGSPQLSSIFHDQFKK